MKLSEKMIERGTFKERQHYPDGDTLTKGETVLKWADEVAQLEAENEDAWNVIKAAYSLEMLLDALGARHSLRDAGPDLDSLTKALEPFEKRLEALLTGESE